MSAERMPTASNNPNIDPALEAAVEDVFTNMEDKVDFPTTEIAPSTTEITPPTTEIAPEETGSETLSTEDKGNIYDRIGRLAGRLSEGAADRKEARSAMKAKLIGFGKSALRIAGKATVTIANAPFVAADKAADRVNQGIQAATEFTNSTIRTVGGELKYAANELGADARVAANDVKESYQNIKANVQETYQDTKESAINFFKEKAQVAKDRKNARLAKISGGFNRIKDSATERVSAVNRRRRALGARALSVVDRARAVKNAAQDTWKQTGEQNQL